VLRQLTRKLRQTPATEAIDIDDIRPQPTASAMPVWHQAFSQKEELPSDTEVSAAGISD